MPTIEVPVRRMSAPSARSSTRIVTGAYAAASGTLSYDSMASLLAPYGSQAALLVARDLDTKIERLLETAAG